MTGVEHTRDGENDDVGATFMPDHWARLTWHQCIAEGCAERVDPWDHSTRCPTHRAEAAADLARVRQLVDAGRRRSAADVARARYPDDT